MKIKIAAIVIITMCLGVKAQENLILKKNDKTLRLLASNPGPEIGSSTGQIIFWYSNIGYNKLVSGDIFSKGKIGIGMEPTQQLQIGTTTNNIAIYNDYINTVNRMIFQSKDSNDGGGFIFRSEKNSGTSDLVSIDRFGNFGIGTTNPSTKLNVRSVVSPTNSYPPNETNDYYKVKDYDLLYLQQDGNSKIGPSIFMKGFNAGNSFSGRITLLENGGTNGDIAFLTSSANGYKQNEVMRVTSKATVGIGTNDTKGFKLGVNGKIAATEVKVAMYSNWPDFVFEKNYNLPILKQVEKQIKEKGHLKDIPSAKEVEKNGILLGEMNAKLLQKIEELTLYTINQQKEIEELKKQKSEIKELKILVKKLLKGKN